MRVPHLSFAVPSPQSPAPLAVRTGAGMPWYGRAADWSLVGRGAPSEDTCGGASWMLDRDSS